MPTEKELLDKMRNLRRARLNTGLAIAGNLPAATQVAVEQGQAAGQQFLQSRMPRDPVRPTVDPIEKAKVKAGLLETLGELEKARTTPTGDLIQQLRREDQLLEKMMEGVIRAHTTRQQVTAEEFKNRRDAVTGVMQDIYYDALQNSYDMGKAGDMGRVAREWSEMNLGAAPNSVNAEEWLDSAATQARALAMRDASPEEYKAFYEVVDKAARLANLGLVTANDPRFQEIQKAARDNAAQLRSAADGLKQEAAITSDMILSDPRVEKLGIVGDEKLLQSLAAIYDMAGDPGNPANVGEIEKLIDVEEGRKSPTMDQIEQALRELDEAPPNQMSNVASRAREQLINDPQFQDFRKRLGVTDAQALRELRRRVVKQNHERRMRGIRRRQAEKYGIESAKASEGSKAAAGAIGDAPEAEKARQADKQAQEALEEASGKEQTAGWVVMDVDGDGKVQAAYRDESGELHKASENPELAMQLARSLKNMPRSEQERFYAAATDGVVSLDDFEGVWDVEDEGSTEVAATTKPEKPEKPEKPDLSIDDVKLNLAGHLEELRFKPVKKIGSLLARKEPETDSMERGVSLESFEDRLKKRRRDRLQERLAKRDEDDTKDGTA